MSPSLPPEATPRTTPPLSGDAPPEQPRGNGNLEAYDALADLFLGDAPGVKPAESDPARRAVAPMEPKPAAGGGVVIEGLILGHLPVLAAVWAAQYARHVSEQTGEPVSLVRVLKEQTTIDVFGDSKEGGGTATLDRAIASARAAARIWIVRADEMSEPGLADLEGLDAVTLLTGADDAAVVASYRTLKSLHERRAVREGAGPEVRVAIMGSSGAKAEEAACKISRAAATFLGLKLKVSVCSAKIGAGKQASMYKGDTPGGTEHALERIVAAVRTARPGAARSEPAKPEDPHGQNGSIPLEPMNGAVVAMPAEPAHPSGLTNGRLAAALAAEASQNGAGGHDDAALPDELPLARHISPSLLALPARCPFAPGVEIAADDDGTIHILARCREGHAPGMAERAALEGLMSVASWAAEHAAVLQFAVPMSEAGVRPVLSSARRPVMHLLTDSPRGVRRLLDAEVRVHLLVPVSLGGRTAWVCRGLN